MSALNERGAFGALAVAAPAGALVEIKPTTSVAAQASAVRKRRVELGIGEAPSVGPRAGPGQVPPRSTDIAK